MWKALIRLVEKWACCHEWEYEFNTTTGITKTCQKCGKIKKIKL